MRVSARLATSDPLFLVPFAPLGRRISPPLLALSRVVSRIDDRPRAVPPYGPLHRVEKAKNQRFYA